jgi:hypothetical protein
MEQPVSQGNDVRLSDHDREDETNQLRGLHRISEGDQMSEYTTEELIKANTFCMGSECAGEECCFYHNGDDYCPISLKKLSADRLRSQQNEIYELKKQIAETYTAEQYQKDVNRMYGVDDAFGSKNTPEQMREWAKSHPEPPKISNGDKFREVFGDGTLNICFKPRNVKCSHIGDIECDACDYGINGAYKQPSDK